MELGRLLHPRTVAVVGATDRAGAYAGQTLLNLRALGYSGEVWGVNPRRSEAHGFRCFPSLRDCPSPPDAVVVAIPAPGVPAVIEEAGLVGCGGAVVYGAGFGEVAAGRGHEAALREAAARHGLPVCGPNGNGIVSLPGRLALWGDALHPQEPGRVVLVSQSGNVAVNALATRRGLRLHTVVSCGNASALDPADWVAWLAREEGVGSIALYLEADGDGARLCEALALCAEHGVGVTVLKVGASPAGATAAAAHTGAIAGDQRVFRSLVEEAGAAWAADVHELLELAKAQAVPPRARRAGPGSTGRSAPPRSDASGDPAPPRSRVSGGLAVLTCSGGDSALAADECARLGLRLPPLGAATARRLRELLPDAATVGNPLDYTALIWGEAETLRDIVAAAGSDPAIDQVLVLYDQLPDLGGAPGESWAAVREGILAGAAISRAQVLVAATLPELLDDDAAARFIAAGIPAVAGLRTALACVAALRRPPGNPARLREIAQTTSTEHGANGRPAGTGLAEHRATPAAERRIPPAGPLAEHEAKRLLRGARVPVVEGRVAVGEADALLAFRELGGPVALKLSAPSLLHKSELGALALDLGTQDEVRAAHRRLAAVPVEAALLVERMAAPGLELIVAARREAVVPALVVGLGGVWAEVHDDVAVVPLPASPERVERALLSLRGAPLLTGARGRTPLDVAAVARLASRVGDVLIDRGLSLLELNPVVVYERGAVAVDAVAR
jgi:acetate---CoA ligase (ADP-forming)